MGKYIAGKKRSSKKRMPKHRSRGVRKRGSVVLWKAQAMRGPGSG
jgi:hypothetical protein